MLITVSGLRKQFRPSVRLPQTPSPVPHVHSAKPSSRRGPSLHIEHVHRVYILDVYTAAICRTLWKLRKPEMDKSMEQVGV